jgi:hypothetical protein
VTGSKILVEMVMGFFNRFGLGIKPKRTQLGTIAYPSSTIDFVY